MFGLTLAVGCGDSASRTTAGGGADTASDTASDSSGLEAGDGDDDGVGADRGAGNGANADGDDDDAGAGDGGDGGGDDSGGDGAGDGGADDAGDVNLGDGFGDEQGADDDAAADSDPDLGPQHERCQLGRHSLAQLDDARCLTFPEDIQLLPGEHMVVARGATPAEFATCYPDFPTVVETGWSGGGAYFVDAGSGVHYIDSSAAQFQISGGLPLMNGDESYELAIGTCDGGLGFGGSGADAAGRGMLIETTTDIPDDQFFNLDRLVPIGPAGSDGSWDIVQEGGRLTTGNANPGRFLSFIHGDLIVSEVSHADTAGCSFVEITCPYTDTVPPPDPECCDVESNMCLSVGGPGECDGIYYPGGGCVEPCDESPPPPPDPACCFFDSGTCGSVAGPGDCDGLFYPSSIACIDGCTAVDPPPVVGQCCQWETDTCVDVSFGDACAGTFFPIGGPACTEPCPRTTPSGACCRFETEDCVDDVLEGYCNNIGTFHPLTSCDDLDCNGSCCQQDGSCEAAGRDDCDGQYLGVGAVCEPDPCRGACCDSDGACAARTEGECSLRHGDFLGYTVACEPNICVGACCNEITGECRQVIEDACASDGDLWHGAGTSCDDVTCDPVDGACCTRFGNCSPTTLDACGEAEADWIGLRTVCEDDTCMGACCNLVTGECAQSVEVDCDPAVAIWHGIGTSCDDVAPCTATIGACCGQDGSCALDSSASCAGLGNEYVSGAFCDAGVCVGACCDRQSGECSEGIAEASCVGTGLTWGGYGSTCADITCDPDQDLDGVIDSDDNCVAIANAFQGDLDGDDEGNICDPTPFECAIAEGGTDVVPFSSLVTEETCIDELDLILAELGLMDCHITCAYGLASRTTFTDDTGTFQHIFECCSTASAFIMCDDCQDCGDAQMVCSDTSPF